MYRRWFEIVEERTGLGVTRRVIEDQRGAGSGVAGGGCPIAR
jgi:hypothetical protein